MGRFLVPTADWICKTFYFKQFKKCINQLKSIETYKVGTKLRDTGNQEQSFEKPVPEPKKSILTNH